MAEEKVLVSGEKPDDEKLGPSATFVAEGQGDYVQVFGVTFKKGESVDLVELLGEERAKPVLRKLANNQTFEVEGGKKAKERGGDPEKLAAMQAASSSVLQEQNRAIAEGREPPEGYDAPLKETLESKPRGQSAEHASERGLEQRRANTPKGRQ